MYRYRLIDEGTGDDLGPFVSLRLTFAVGEALARAGGEQFSVVNVVESENENFRAYVIVRAEAERNEPPLRMKGQRLIPSLTGAAGVKG